MSTSVERRRASTRDDILTAAWNIVREEGFAGLGMRELGSSVGMTAGALYRYFPSKMHIYDALFAEAHRELQAHMAVDRATGDAEAAFRESAHRLMAFCVADTTRFALMFQRPIPDFVPSDESMASARRSYQQLLDQLGALGITDQRRVDLWAAVHMGLTSQQVANDPGGDRWVRLVDEAVDMFLAHRRRDDEGSQEWE